LSINKHNRPERSLTSVDINNLTHGDIRDIVSLFAQAAKRAEKAAFDGVQIHLACGWFLNRFVNPHYCHRKDEYGAAPKNRARIVFEILDALKEATPTLHITAKFSFCDKNDRDTEIADCVEICRQLSEEGIGSTRDTRRVQPKK